MHRTFHNFILNFFTFGYIFPGKLKSLLFPKLRELISSLFKLGKAIIDCLILNIKFANLRTLMVKRETILRVSSQCKLNVPIMSVWTTQFGHCALVALRGS